MGIGEQQYLGKHRSVRGHGNELLTVTAFCQRQLATLADRHDIRLAGVHDQDIALADHMVPGGYPDRHIIAQDIDQPPFAVAEQIDFAGDLADIG